MLGIKLRLLPRKVSLAPPLRRRCLGCCSPLRCRQLPQRLLQPLLQALCPGCLLLQRMLQVAVDVAKLGALRSQLRAQRPPLTVQRRLGCR